METAYSANAAALYESVSMLINMECDYDEKTSLRRELETGDQVQDAVDLKVRRGNGMNQV